jgi:anti-sigma B factor antagonist
MSTYNIETNETRCQLAVRGPLTAILVPELQQELKAGIEKGVREITFDLAGSDMMDSSGIGLLIATSNTLANKEGKLAVINTSAELLKLLRSMRLVTRLNITGRAGGERDHE